MQVVKSCSSSVDKGVHFHEQLASFIVSETDQQNVLLPMALLSEAVQMLKLTSTASPSDKTDAGTAASLILQLCKHKVGAQLAGGFAASVSHAIQDSDSSTPVARRHCLEILRLFVHHDVAHVDESLEILLHVGESCAFDATTRRQALSVTASIVTQHIQCDDRVLLHFLIRFSHLLPGETFARAAKTVQEAYISTSRIMLERLKGSHGDFVKTYAEHTEAVCVIKAAASILLEKTDLEDGQINAICAACLHQSSNGITPALLDFAVFSQLNPAVHAKVQELSDRSLQDNCYLLLAFSQLLEQMPPQCLDTKLLLSVVYSTIRTKTREGGKPSLAPADVQCAYVKLLGISLLSTPEDVRPRNWDVVAQHCLSDGQLCVDALTLLRGMSQDSKKKIDQCILHQPLEEFSTFMAQTTNDALTHYPSWRNLSLLARVGAICGELFVSHHADSFDHLLNFLHRVDQEPFHFQSVAAVLGVVKHYICFDISYRPQILKLINTNAEPLMQSGLGAEILGLVIILPNSRRNAIYLVDVLHETLYEGYESGAVGYGARERWVLQLVRLIGEAALQISARVRAKWQQSLHDAEAGEDHGSGDCCPNSSVGDDADFNYVRAAVRTHFADPVVLNYFDAC